MGPYMALIRSRAPEKYVTVKVFFGARGVKFLEKRRENAQIFQALR
jgi:hypothetical protein